MQAHVAPTMDKIERIRQIDDPVVRNLQITQAYHELSQFMADRTGLAANWCTFATWASKQAGQTIRKEDLERLLERLLNQSLAARQASQNMAAAANLQGEHQVMAAQSMALSGSNFTSAVDRASDAVGRGNKKVFEEIGHEFARFYQTCLIDQPPLPERLASFNEQLRPDGPPDGQAYLRQAFTHYFQALVEDDRKTRAELILLANLEIGFHEQTRLQPEIAESMDSGLVSFFDFARTLFQRIFPAKGWFHLAHLYLMRLVGRPTALDLAIQTLLVEVGVQLRRLITELMMTIALPSGVVLRLGEDLTAGFPASLQQITQPELIAFLRQHDLSPDSTHDSGAVDWADLPDRLHFIVDLFRCYHETPGLFEPPFTPEQVKALKSGQRPTGRL